MGIHVIPSDSIKAFRYRVHCLGQSLWQERDPVCRANLALQLADAAATLAQLEALEVEKLQPPLCPPSS